MIRLFLKLYGVLIATLVLSFVVQMQLMEYVWHEMTAGFDFRVRFVPTFHLIEDALADVPAAERAGRFDQLAAGFGMPARLAPAADLPEAAHLKPDQRTTFERG